jgi:hypothetical protein
VQAAGNISVYEMGKVHREKRKGFFSFLVLIQEAGKVVLLQCVCQKSLKVILQYIPGNWQGC